MVTVNSTQDDLLKNVHTPILKVMGLGGGGCNAVERMMDFNLHGIEFIEANTDYQVLRNYSAPVKIQLGPHLTKGLGAGGDPRIGKDAAEESIQEIKYALEGADMVFLTAGMGGGTGTGAIPVAAKVARELGAVTIAIVTTPFSFEMGKRLKNARNGIEELCYYTHTLVTIPNDKLIKISPRNLPIETAFRLADDVLRQAVQAISEVIYEPGLINVDFANIQRLMRMGGGTLMSIGHGNGFDKVQNALDQALHHPLLDDIEIKDAAGIIANFTGGEDLTLAEVEYALNQLNAQTGDQTDIVFGVIQNSQMKDRVQVTLMVTGLGSPSLDFIEANNQNDQKTRSLKIQEKTDHTSHQNYDPVIDTEPEYDLPIPSIFETKITTDSNIDLPAFLRKRTRMVVTN